MRNSTNTIDFAEPTAEFAGPEILPQVGTILPCASEVSKPAAKLYLGAKLTEDEKKQLALCVMAADAQNKIGQSPGDVLDIRALPRKVQVTGDRIQKFGDRNEK
jgi:hypothetical protein